MIQLTNNLYRLTLLFPKKEPLRYRIREAATGFLAKPNEQDLEVLDSFFEVAAAQNWVSPDNILAIQKEYANLRADLGLFEVESRPVQPTEVSSALPGRPACLPERQEKILEFLREQGRAQVWQVKEVLPEVTKRTLRRDFDNLLRQGAVERIGERNNTFYQLKTLSS